MKNSGLRKGFLIFIGVLFVGYFLGTGVYDLVNKNGLYTVRIKKAYEFMEVEHAINGLIPIGKDYYYLGIDDNSGAGWIIKASKSWYRKNFGEDGSPVFSEAADITALAKKDLDYDLEKAMAERMSQTEGIEFAMAPAYSLVLNYRLIAISKLLLMAAAAALAGIAAYFSKTGREISGMAKKAYIGAIVLVLILMLKVMV